jgi:hypothetical protein
MATEGRQPYPGLAKSVAASADPISVHLGDAPTRMADSYYVTSSNKGQKKKGKGKRKCAKKPAPIRISRDRGIAMGLREIEWDGE